MGAGYPIGALITRREIADSLARDYEYFSTFAATPAAAAAGLAVLDVLENERIPERTRTVGDHVRARLRDLAGHDARLGEVRGTGLIAGTVLKVRPPLIWRTGEAGLFAAAVAAPLSGTD
jgi:4-aminobutyrate aminotransferase-like enzyme